MTADIDRELLITELKMLRKGRGVTVNRLVLCPLLMDLLGSPPDPLAALRDQVADLGDDYQVLALLVAYGYERKELTLAERRDGFAYRLEKHPDTIERWENSMIEELATRLLRTGPAHVSQEDYLAKALVGVFERLRDFHHSQQESWQVSDDERALLEAEAEQASERVQAARPTDYDSIEAVWAYSRALMDWAGKDRAYSQALYYERGRIDVLKALADLSRELTEGLSEDRPEAQ